MPAAQIEIGEIFRRYGQRYRRKYGGRMPGVQFKAMRAIAHCRMSALGGHIDECDECGIPRISYNSCRNRHCPKCQSIPTERWVRSRSREVLPVDYYQVVFTVPDILNDLLYGNPREGYDLFFTAASKTLLELASNTVSGPKKRVYLGARIGVTSILHTWGQNLLYHPHIHCLVSGGGLSHDKQKWISLPHRKYFIPVEVLSVVFRGKFLDYLERAYHSLRFNHHTAHLADLDHFRRFIAVLRGKEWVVHCEAPPKNTRPESLIKYFGRYTHRVAISNHRIVKLANHKVYFKWTDYADADKTKIMSLDALEFIRRFLLHVLPKGFVKIRYYGFMSNPVRRKNIALCRERLQVEDHTYEEAGQKESVAVLMLVLTGVDIHRCPHCKKGRMVTKLTRPPVRNHSPPSMKEIA